MRWPQTVRGVHVDRPPGDQELRAVGGHAGLFLDDPPLQLGDARTPVQLVAAAQQPARRTARVDSPAPAARSRPPPSPRSCSPGGPPARCRRRWWSAARWSHRPGWPRPAGGARAARTRGGAHGHRGWRPACGCPRRCSVPSPSAQMAGSDSRCCCSVPAITTPGRSSTVPSAAIRATTRPRAPSCQTATKFFPSQATSGSRWGWAPVASGEADPVDGRPLGADAGGVDVRARLVVAAVLEHHHHLAAVAGDGRFGLPVAAGRDQGAAGGGGRVQGDRPQVGVRGLPGHGPPGHLLPQQPGRAGDQVGPAAGGGTGRSGQGGHAAVGAPRGRRPGAVPPGRRASSPRDSTAHITRNACPSQLAVGPPRRVTPVASGAAAASSAVPSPSRRVARTWALPSGAHHRRRGQQLRSARHQRRPHAGHARQLPQRSTARAPGAGPGRPAAAAGRPPCRPAGTANRTYRRSLVGWGTRRAAVGPSPSPRRTGGRPRAALAIHPRQEQPRPGPALGPRPSSTAPPPPPATGSRPRRRRRRARPPPAAGSAAARPRAPAPRATVRALGSRTQASRNPSGPAATAAWPSARSSVDQRHAARVQHLAVRPQPGGPQLVLPQRAAPGGQELLAVPGRLGLGLLARGPGQHRVVDVALRPQDGRRPGRGAAVAPVGHGRIRLRQNQRGQAAGPHRHGATFRPAAPALSSARSMRRRHSVLAR